MVKKVSLVLILTLLVMLALPAGTALAAPPEFDPNTGITVTDNGLGATTGADVSVTTQTVNFAPSSDLNYESEITANVAVVDITLHLTPDKVDKILNEKPGDSGAKAPLGFYYYGVTANYTGDAANQAKTYSGHVPNPIDTPLDQSLQTAHKNLVVSTGTKPNSTVWTTACVLEIFNGTAWVRAFDGTDASFGNGDRTNKSLAAARLGIGEDELVYGENYRIAIVPYHLLIAYSSLPSGASMLDGNWQGKGELKSGDGIIFVKVTFTPHYDFPITGSVNGNLVYYKEIGDALRDPALSEIRVNSDTTLSQSIPAGTKVTVASGATLTVESSGVIGVAAAPANEGTIVVENGGTLNVASSFENKGTIENSGTISGTATIDNAGTIFVKSEGTLSSDLTNEGTIVNAGTISNTVTIANAGNVYSEQALGTIVTGTAAAPVEQTLTYSFDSTGGSPGAVQQLTVKKSFATGSEVVNMMGALPADPTRQGYVFDGWYTNSSGTGGSLVSPDAIAAGLIGMPEGAFYALWTQVDAPIVNPTPTSPTSPTTTPQTSSTLPATGDSNMGSLWIILLLVSGSCALAAGIKHKHTRQKTHRQP